MKFNQPSIRKKIYIYFAWPLIQENKKSEFVAIKSLSIVEPLQTTFSLEVSHNQILNYTFDVLDETAKIDTSFSKQVKILGILLLEKVKIKFRKSIKCVNRFFAQCSTSNLWSRNKYQS